ncbi:MAG: hypothetical protein K2O71_00665 [Lachnospiraceae bacterium]|nr:hypothetical protein [Lachnospiraceae bacterium]
MQRILCPFCDREIKGKGKCDFCGSWVKKPVITETSEEIYPENFSSVASAAAAGAGISPDLSDREQKEAALGSQAASPGQTETVQRGQRSTAPRRAVLASEAVERGQTAVKGSNSKIVVRGIVIVIIVNIILQLLFLLFNI